jgi:Holliday junction resolvase RusA-like endonuclease
MKPCIQFQVPGRPQQRGSKTAFVVRNKQKQMIRRGGGIVTNARDVPIINQTDSNKKSTKYMELAQRIAQVSYRGDPLEGPVCFEVVFKFKRPKCHYRTGKHADQLRDDAPTHHTKQPDLAKLIRGIEDAMTQAGIWKDDSQVVTYGTTRKEWTDSDGFAMVTIIPLCEQDLGKLLPEEHVPF